MYILIPTSSDEGLNAKITTQADMKTWALIEFENGKAKSVQFAEDRTTFGVEWIDFAVVEYILQSLPATVKTIIVDIHAEATSEKAAMAHFLTGKVTAVVGTHTHVQTADAKILDNHTAFITDVGMVGAEYSILGREVKAVVDKFYNGMPQRLPVVEKGIRLDAVVISYNEETGQATAIKNISRMSSI